MTTTAWSATAIVLAKVSVACSGDSSPVDAPIADAGSVSADARVDAGSDAASSAPDGSTTAAFFVPGL